MDPVAMCASTKFASTIALPLCMRWSRVFGFDDRSSDARSGRVTLDDTERASDATRASLAPLPYRRHQVSEHALMQCGAVRG